MSDSNRHFRDESRYDSRNEEAHRDMFSLDFWKELYDANTQGVLGFGAAILSLLFHRSGLLSFALWIAGIVLSVMGLKKKPQWPAIAGLGLSVIGLFVLIFFMGIIAGLLSLVF